METVIVGAPTKNVNGVNATGAAYIFQRDQGGTDNWGLVSSFSLANTSYNSTGDEHFGSSVAVSGKYAVVGCPQCSGRSVREFSAGQAYLFGCSAVNATSQSCTAWTLVKELVPEPSGTSGPLWCGSPLTTTGLSGEWTCHRAMDNFGNSVAVFGCCDATGALIAPFSGDRSFDTQCDLSAVCTDAVVAVGNYLDSTAGILGEGYDRRGHGSVYLYDNRHGNDTFAQVNGLTSSGRTESEYVGQEQKVTAVDEDEDTLFGRHVFLGPCINAVGRESTCLAVARTSCLNRVCRTPLSPATGIAHCYCEPSEHGYANELYIYERHLGGTDTWGFYIKFCDETFECPAPPNCTNLYATASQRIPYEVLQTHYGPGDSATETPTNPNGDETREDYNCLGADGTTGAINAGPCVSVPCTPFGLTLKQVFFGNAAQVYGAKAIVGDYSWENNGGAFIVRRPLASVQELMDFQWIPWTIDTLQS